MLSIPPRGYGRTAVPGNRQTARRRGRLKVVQLELEHQCESLKVQVRDFEDHGELWMNWLSKRRRLCITLASGLGPGGEPGRAVPLEGQ